MHSWKAVGCGAFALLFCSSSATLQCSSLASSLVLIDVNATIYSSEYITANTTIIFTGGQEVCQNSTTPEVDICRVTFEVYTSARSSSFIEVWLPSGTASSTAWNGRLVSSGGGGLSGCVDYDTMVYTSGLGFATTGDNSGHDGTAGDGTPFLDNSDVVIDFSYRARHAAAVVGKQVVKQYYGSAHKKSYYFGCSTGGRQGLKAAQMYPGDYDGIIAGSPASNFNHLAAWSGHFITLTGLNESDSRWLNLAQWTAVHDEVLNQCDMLDGVPDGILEDSSICNFNPETLLCSNISNSTTCLTNVQAQTVRNVYRPLYGLNNTYIHPRLSPSAELTSFELTGFGGLAGGLTGPGPQWFQNAIYNDPAWDPTTFNALDIAYADSLDAKNGFVSSYSGDLSAFRDRGGRLISYHGGADGVIPGDEAMRYYGHVATTMNASNTDLDDFFRTFRISGMGHCVGGDGAWAFGQEISARDASSNVLWDLVRWVENGTAPERIVGTKWVDDDSSLGVEFQRPHCRYPYRTTFQGGDPNVTSSWGCKYIDDWNVCGGPSDKLPKLC